MPFSGLWRRVGHVRTDVSEERIASIFRVETIRERREALAVSYQTIANVFLHSRIFLPEDAGDTFLRYVGSYVTHTASHPRNRHCS
jgi:hypothetical protein